MPALYPHWDRSIQRLWSLFKVLFQQENAIKIIAIINQKMNIKFVVIHSKVSYKSSCIANRMDIY